MDGVSAAASIGQLVGFGGKVTMTLIRLIRDISRGPVTYKNEETNVRHLLLLVRRIATEKDCHTHDFLELFARVDATAQKILQLLQGATSSLLFRVVSAITKHRALAEAFGELYATRELLHFHISCTLSQDVRACLEAGTGQACKDLEMDSVESPMSPVTGQEDCPVQGFSRAIPGPSHPRRRPRFEIVGNKIGYNALIDIGDDTAERCNQIRLSEEGPVIINGNETRDYVTIRAGNVARRDFNDTLAAHRKVPVEAAQPRPPFSGNDQTPRDRAGSNGVPHLTSSPPCALEAPVRGRLAALGTELPCSDRRNLLGQPTTAEGIASRRAGIWDEHEIIR